MKEPSFDFETLVSNVKDANYSHWENPFSPEYEIVWTQFEFKPLATSNLRYNVILSKEFYVPYTLGDDGY